MSLNASSQANITDWISAYKLNNPAPINQATLARIGDYSISVSVLAAVAR